jgi:glycosyltransferase involved in cell wall biosynthesis
MERVSNHPPSCELTVIIPVLNEIKTLPEIVRRVQALCLDKEIIIVDNVSTDGTREFVKSLEGVRKVFQPKNLGRGASVRKGIELATGEYTVIHDADLEYHPEDLVHMLALAKSNGADAVYGSRVLGGRKTNYYSYYLGTVFLTSVINVLCGARLTDAGTALKMARTGLLQRIEQQCNGFDWDFEITTKLCLAGVEIVEYAARYRPRTHREGKKITALNGLPSLRAILWSWVAARFGGGGAR